MTTTLAPRQSGFQQAPNYRPDGLSAAEDLFSARFPDFDPDGSFAALRRREYGRLDSTDAVYLDYTGGSLHAASQLESHVELLQNGVFGNPHSNNPTSLAATTLVERTRDEVCAFFHAPRDEYMCGLHPNMKGTVEVK